ncbi:uncharacterized protein LOC124154393 isoform X3 [Ischnura elegans]|uniref:uncharacterized protein LOC124154393 isoform X3 n=1 Tax=Ischnura elegans TaxID=197161 RepID=UPI001ED8BFB8|nr:uncharacterized protein LOC124154393 isoform X3 [Ischnura elegans]
MVLYNETKYVKSKHICRKQDEIFQCLRETVNELKTFSNKSVTMVPFVGGLVEESIRGLCDNDAELLSAVFLVISTFVFASPPPGYEDLLEPAIDCYRNELSEEMMNETRRLVGQPLVYHANIFAVVTKEEALCFRNATDTCDHHLDFIHNMEVVAFCDSANPDTDPFTQEYMCRKLADFLDCSKELIASCAENIVKTLSIFKTKLLNSDVCAAYN